MAMSQRSRVTIYTGLRKVVDEAAVVELLSFFPVRGDELTGSRRSEHAEGPCEPTTSERLACIEARLSLLEGLASDCRERLACIEQHIEARSTS